MQFPQVSPRVRNTALVGFGIGLAGLALVALLFISVGGVDVSADKPHGWLTEHLLHFTFKRSVAMGSSTVFPPADLDQASRVKLGAQHYDMVCANCHGGPGIGQSAIALSMRPRPQSLPAVVKQFTDPELFWIVKHGVKFSAMPSWPNQVRNDEVWSMVAFLKKLPAMSAADYRDITAAPQPAPDTKQIAAEKAPAIREADQTRNTAPEHEYLYAVPAIGFADVRLRSDPILVCSRCHGSDGTGSATDGEAANLTLQSAEYMKAALNAFALGSRKSGFMQLVAGQLSAEQINAISDYYAALPAKASPVEKTDTALLERGKKIATEGIKADAVPACATCHESAGGKPIAAPHIAGQSQKFLRHELDAMRYGGRGATGLWNPMPAVAHQFSDQDIAAVAAYYASLPPEKASAAAAAAVSTPAPKVAAGDQAKGEKIFASVCATCHFKGAHGDDAGGFPNLTIQTPAYLTQTLRAYRARTKLNPQMNAAARGLEDADIADVTTYLGDMKADPSPVRGKPDAAARGEAIAKDGIGVRGVPACLKCHGADAVKALPLIARLQGQNANYIKSRLDYFATVLAEQNETALNPMPAMARQLSDAERADVAAYFASAPPLDKVQQ